MSDNQFMQYRSFKGEIRDGMASYTTKILFLSRNSLPRLAFQVPAIQSRSCPVLRCQSHVNSALRCTRSTPSSLCHYCSTTSLSAERPSIISRTLRRLGVPGKLKYKKPILRRAGLRLYLCCVEMVDHDTISTELALPDTFNSWFRITELNVWLCLVRLAQEGAEGVYVRNQLVTYLWQDVEKRSRILGEMVSSPARRSGILQLANNFKGALFAYDEGLLGCDRVLAGALWRNLMDRNCADPARLELMVHYVRKQVQFLDRQSTEALMCDGVVTFLPLYGATEDGKRNKQILTEIVRRT